VPPSQRAPSYTAEPAQTPSDEANTNSIVMGVSIGAAVLVAVGFGAGLTFFMTRIRRKQRKRAMMRMAASRLTRGTLDPSAAQPQESRHNQL